MKKLLLIIAAVFTLTGVHADLILHESFDREVGNLNAGELTTSTTDTKNWYTNMSGGTQIQVVEGSLSYSGYATGTGNMVSMKGNTSSLRRDMRLLDTEVNSGKVYLSAIINVDEINTKTGDKGYCTLMFGDGTGSGSKLYARLFIRSAKDAQGEFTGKFQMGVTKNNESSVGIPYTTEEYSVKTNYLVILEYEFVEGAKNDTARLYINPTKATTIPTLECTQEAKTSSGTAQGANSKEDATTIKSVHLYQQTYNPLTKSKSLPLGTTSLPKAATLP